MIKKAIAYIQMFCEGIPKPFKGNPDPFDYKYEEGSRDVAENVLQGLEDIPELYSIHEFNPYAKGDKWEEIAVTRAPDYARDIAESLCRDHHGQIELRYEYKNNTVFTVEKVGVSYHHKILSEVKK